MGEGTASLTLDDGRRLGLAEYGDPAGEPVLYFHGVLGSRHEGRLLGPPARALGLRILALERPGYGRSSPAPADGLRSWAGAVAGVMDALGVGRAALVGVSGGGPFALACAAALPGRVRALSLVGSLAPLRPGLPWLPLVRRYFALARRLPGLVRPGVGLLVPWLRRDPLGFLDRFTRGTPPVDRQALAGPEARDLFALSLPEAVRQGGAGVARDLRLLTRPWDLDPAEVQVPVALWHGEADRTVPVALGRDLAAALPRARPCFLPGEGHFSLPIGRCGEILTDLAVQLQVRE